MKTDNIELVSYTKGEEILNVITHSAGLIIPLFILIKFVPLCDGNLFALICALLYAAGTAFSFISSVIYHGLKEGNAKRIMRVVDHSAIFFAVAGTVTGCVPAVFSKGSTIGAVLMLVLSWSSVILGLILTVFFFGRFKAFRMTLYILTAALCALFGSETYFHLPVTAFICLISGGAVLLVGCVFLRIGAEKRYIHSVFHIFIVMGLGIYCFGIYNFVYLLL